MRAAVLPRLAPGCGLRAEGRSLTPAEVGRAEAVLFTNSARLPAPVTAVGGTVFREAVFGETAPGSLGHPAGGGALRTAVARDCGVDEGEVA